MYGQMEHRSDPPLGGAPAPAPLDPLTCLRPSRRLPAWCARVLVFPVLGVPSPPELLALITSL